MEILVCLEGSASTHRAVDVAIDLARTLPAGLVGLAIVDAPDIVAGAATPIGGASYRRDRDAALLADAHQHARAWISNFLTRGRAAGVAGGAPAGLSGSNLGALAAHPTGQQLLAAVSCGSVFMGAVTYIGNGPNFMVKAIAEQHHVRMPSFFGYTLWSFTFLIPLFGAVALLFF